MPSASASLDEGPVAKVHDKGAGSAGDLVLVHGTLDRAASFGPVIRHLPGWKVVTYDRRGWGRSRSLGGEHVSLETHVHDLVHLISTMTSHPVVVGHSFGGIVALCAAARSPIPLRAVVAYEPPVRWLPWWPAEAPWERIVQEAAAQGAEAVATAMLTAVTGQPPGPTQTRPGELEANGRALLTEMNDPCLKDVYFDPDAMADLRVVVGAGSDSLPHHFEASRRLAMLIDHGRFVVLPGCGHAAHVANPELFACLIETAAAT